MQDRETALKEQENAREWQAIAYGDHPATWAALAYYRERGWPVDANTFPERDRCENRIFAFKAGYAAALASPLSAPPQEPTMLVQLTADDVEWVVNDNAELGVKIGQQFFFCYKGHSLVYDTGAHDDGTPMMWRPVFKREFGECVRPVNYADLSRIGTVSLADSDQWKPLSAPISPQEPTGASPQAEELRAANVANLREMVGMAGRHRETLLAVRECILALSPGHRTGYDWNADPLFLTLKEGRALNLIDDALKATPASPQAEPSRCAETCGLLRCRLNEGHSGLHQVYNAATGDFQQFIGQLAPVSPVDPTPEPETCAWKCDSDDSGMWETACGRFWEFNEDGPKENRVHFCFFCGKPLRLVEDTPR